MFDYEDFRKRSELSIEKRIHKNLTIFRLQELQKKDLDFDVYLPTYKRNLQRDKVWKDYQRSDYILSLLKRIYIPPISCLIDDTEKENKYEIIDGKQRLTTILDFLDNSFPIEVNNKFYFYKDFTLKSQASFRKIHISANVVYTSKDCDPVSDLEKVEWFLYINYRGTPQDKKHLDTLNRLVCLIKEQ